MDDSGAFSYLQPDKSASVRFYQMSGFTVIAKSKIPSVCNWSVSRPSRNGGAGSWPVESRLRISAKPFNDRLCAFLLAWTSLVVENGLR